ncbi:hypothetical protein A3I41_05475 [Candidatus Uhrbacteria bacterium RIFCSPLOWO2_02_FULL_48_18]|uniref:DUF5659 domain-containing protein n=1 Tax=Candidatus Uhrbacteria bacterium RIFCSPLOWO2_02_FULL_48_18 TaxID=1802408 RepID=A0A1F7V9K1_9BACT|nr:MAG: hypothetical protein A3B20_00705 [Candidatus Uhrbacteria bacterium RIFCSPLOWO2_01_FULL_47_17]OGL86747.1 MAG: hypothetical protein A3I41_05475 [Candidatus Uhrbacteria bacterium RIFCSPLOWO2_02_FULL_48_18]
MTTQNSEETSFYKTGDLNLATTIFLFRPLEAIDKTSDPRKKSFIFSRDSELDELIEQFWRDEIRVSPRAYFSALREIKVRLYEN